MLRNTHGEWGALAKGFHWLIAVLVLIMIALGFIATNLPRGPLRLELFMWHKSTGVLILALMTVRIAWRLVNPVPISPPGLSTWEHLAARVVHWLLYAALFVMPISGYVTSAAANSPVVFYRLFPLPLLVAPDRNLHELAEEIHIWTAYFVIALLVLHIAAALRHHFVLRNDVLKRMLPGAASG